MDFRASRTSPGLTPYELQIRTVACGIPAAGRSAEQAVRAYVYSHGAKRGTIIDVRDEDGRVATFICYIDDEITHHN